MYKINLSLFILIISSQLFACSGAFKHTLDFSPYEPLRIAVLPFRQIDQDNKLIEETGELLIDNIPIISSENPDGPTALSRKLVLAELKKTSLDIISPSLIDIDLPHRNLAYPNGKFNLERIFSIPAKTYCNDFLDCDAVLFGTIKKWNRDYYGIQSNTEIEIEIKIVSAKTEKTIFISNAKDSDSRGILKGPTGYSSLILEPIKGLDSEIVEDLARRTIAKMLEPLKKSKNIIKENSSPPAILAVSHSASNGELKKNDTLFVLALGTPNCIASFSIGNYSREIPMLEESSGHYTGEFWPLDNETFVNQIIIVNLLDKSGRLTKLEVDTGPVSLKKD